MRYWCTFHAYRVHKLDNCQNALDMIAQAGVKLEFVKPVSIVDGNQTLILGLIWTLICEASIKTSLKAIGVATGKAGGADQGLKVRRFPKQELPEFLLFHTPIP